MAENFDPTASLDFQLDSTSPSKRPEQLVNLLERELGREFPKALEIVDIVHAPGERLVSVRHLEKLDEETSKNLAHLARGVFSNFMTSPWY